MGIPCSTRVLHWNFNEWILHVQVIHPKDEVIAISRHDQNISTINQNALYFNSRRHHKGIRRCRKVFGKTRTGDVYQINR